MTDRTDETSDLTIATINLNPDNLTKIWQVKVYEDNKTDYTLYHFQKRESVILSIYITWGKDSKWIKINETTDGGIIVTSLEDGQLLVVAEEISFHLHNRSVHF